MTKISLCTVCMNRYTYLRETLPVNIEENMDYPQVEFIVLNYNSKDDLDSWIRSDMMVYIEKGILHYYRTDEPEFFDPSHSKNMAMKLGSGDILGMVDADNYAGPGYARWVNSVFELNDPRTIITTLSKNRIPYRDQGGKFCLSRELFYTVNGFDESLMGYGMDDVDLISRAERAGGIRYPLDENRFLKFIGHSMKERVENFSLINNLERIYMKYPESNGPRANVLYILKDKTYFEVKYAFSKDREMEWITSLGGWTMVEDSHRTGSFVRDAERLTLRLDGQEAAMDYLEKKPGVIISVNGGKKSFLKEINQDESLYLDLVVSFGECMNRLKYVKNDSTSFIVNHAGWGRGEVYKNFDTSTPIRI
jgi:hypothetical protein